MFGPCQTHCQCAPCARFLNRFVMKNIKLIAACALLVSVSAAFSHENMPRHAAAPTAQQQPKEQQAWGVAGDAPHMAHVSPGNQGDVVWHFNRPGQFDFACLIPGHYQAGMTGTITVVASSH